MATAQDSEKTAGSAGVAPGKDLVHDAAAAGTANSRATDSDTPGSHTPGSHTPGSHTSDSDADDSDADDSDGTDRAAGAPAAVEDTAGGGATGDGAAYHGAADDGAAGPAAVSQAGGGHAMPARGRALARRLTSASLPVLLSAVTVVLGGLAVWFALEAHALRSDPAVQNTALTDRAATRQVSHDIASAVDTIFSYNYAHMSRSDQAAHRLLTGKAVGQYDTLIKTVRQQALARKLVLTTTVLTSGVELLQGDRARLLIFADQRDTMAGTSQASYAGAMFAVDAVRVGGTWKIESLDIFTGST